MADSGPGTSTPDSSFSSHRSPNSGFSWAPGDGAHTGPVGDASVLELIGRLINDFSALVDKQIELARQEVREDVGEVVGHVKTLAIGAGIAAMVGLLVLIWAWTAFIWFFNWLGSLVTIGPVSFGWIGWLIAPIVAGLIGFFAWKKFLQRGLDLFKIRPLERTRATIKEDLEWVQQLRTRSTR